MADSSSYTIFFSDISLERVKVHCCGLMRTEFFTSHSDLTGLLTVLIIFSIRCSCDWREGLVFVCLFVGFVLFIWSIPINIAEFLTNSALVLRLQGKKENEENSGYSIISRSLVDLLIYFILPSYFWCYIYISQVF